MDEPAPTTAAVMFAAGRGGEAIRLVGRERADSEVAVLGELVAQAMASSAAQQRCFADLVRGRGFERGAVLSAAKSLAGCGLYEAAIAILPLAYPERDPTGAFYRASWAMQLSAYEQVVAASEIAIESMLRARSSVPRMVERGLAGEPPQSLLQFEIRDVARMPRLRRPLVLRWEALRRLGRNAEAAAMRDLLLRWWASRVSVWETAGNHALEDLQPLAAERYFQRALELDPGSIVALAGLAIVREMDKDWSSALALRREVADREAAWAADDPASLQRVIRYAANLGRLGRWHLAGPHLRACVRRGAFAKLPLERDVLLRVFSRELYAPAMVATMLAESTLTPATVPAAVRFALRDAFELADLSQALSVEPRDADLSLGMCAWLAGDTESASSCFERAHRGRADSVVTAYLHLASSIETGRTHEPELEHGVVQLAEHSLLQLGRSAAADHFYATLALRRWSDGRSTELPSSPFQSLLELPRNVPAAEVAPAIPARPRGVETAFDRVCWRVAVREACIAAGYAFGLASRIAARADRA